jgi:hypothetical protein
MKEFRVFCTLIAADENLEAMVLGNAFVVRDNGDSAVCIGAAHSFEAVKNVQRARSAVGHANVAPGFERKGPHYLAPDLVKAVFLIDGEAVICQVHQFNYIDNYDVVLFTVLAPEGRNIFKYRMAIDLGAPVVGEEVAVIANHYVQTKMDDGHSEVALRLEMRRGVVTEVTMGRRGLAGLSLYFRTTIPVTGGMSGAAVVRKPTLHGAAVALGVVSSDHSDKAAFSDYMVPGDSAASMLWPAMGLAINLTIPPDPDRCYFLGEILDKGLLDNKSRNVSTQVRQVAGKTQILYIDARQQPPVKCLLTTTGHPNCVEAALPRLG